MNIPTLKTIWKSKTTKTKPVDRSEEIDAFDLDALDPYLPAELRGLRNSHTPLKDWPTKKDTDFNGKDREFKDYVVEDLIVKD